jgi:hypothetical protein
VCVHTPKTPRARPAVPAADPCRCRCGLLAAPCGTQAHAVPSRDRQRPLPCVRVWGRCRVALLTAAGITACLVTAWLLRSVSRARAVVHLIVPTLTPRARAACFSVKSS